MLAVSDMHRKKGIGSTLVRLAMQRMRDLGCEQVTGPSSPCLAVAGPA